jgi:hypothetical protein
MPPVKTFGERIADALVEDGLLTAAQVEELLEQQKKEGTRLLKLIIEKAYVSEADMAVSMGRVLNTPPINLPRLAIPLEVADLVPREMAYNHKVVPVSRLENKLFLAMADPKNVLAIDDVRRITRLEVATLIASEKAILDKLNHIDASKSGSMEDIIQDAQKTGRRSKKSTSTNSRLPARKLRWSNWPTSSLFRRSKTASVMSISSRLRRFCGCATALTASSWMRPRRPSKCNWPWSRGSRS